MQNIEQNNTNQQALQQQLQTVLADGQMPRLAQLWAEKEERVTYLFKCIVNGFYGFHTWQKRDWGAILQCIEDLLGLQVVLKPGEGYAFACHQDFHCPEKNIWGRATFPGLDPEDLDICRAHGTWRCVSQGFFNLVESRQDTDWWGVLFTLRHQPELARDLFPGLKIWRWEDQVQCEWQMILVSAPWRSSEPTT